MAELNLWLDSYDDIYSDLDSRHYPKRRISEDFLHELRTEIKYKENISGDLLLLLPEKKRVEQSEKIIAESLAGFFISRFHLFNHKCRHLLVKSTIILITGLFLMLFNSWISYYKMTSFALVAVKVLIEPAGWFLLWLAFDFLFYDYPGLKKEKHFFRQLANMHVSFRNS